MAFLNILVTGGAGYIGSMMVPELLAAGHRVTVLDNFRYEQNSLATVCAHPEFTVIRGDVRVPSVMEPLLSKADIIIPLAAYVGAPLCSKDPVGATSTNRDAVLWMLKQLSTNQMVVMPTTNSAYGTSDANGYCDESSPLKPLSLYAKDKVEVEEALMSHPSSVSLRLATVFGMSPRMRIDLLVNDFVYRAKTDRFLVLFESHFRRNFIHIRDVVRAFLHVINNWSGMKGEIFNVGLSDANLSKKELCERIKVYLPEFVFLDAPVGTDPDQRDYLVSNAKIEKTGFNTKYGLDSGIQELIKGYTTISNSVFSNV